MADIRKFRFDMKRFVEVTRIRSSVVLRRVGLELFNSLVSHSPVDTGRLRNSWTASQNFPLFTDAGEDFYNPSSTPPYTIDRNIGLEDSIWISNGVHYVERIEEGTQNNPDGIVQPSIKEVEKQVDAIVEAARRVR